MAGAGIEESVGSNIGVAKAVLNLRIRWGLGQVDSVAHTSKLPPYLGFVGPLLLQRPRFTLFLNAI